MALPMNWPNDETNPNYQIVVRPLQFGMLSQFIEAPLGNLRLVIPSSFLTAVAVDIRASSFFVRVLSVKSV